MKTKYPLTTKILFIISLSGFIFFSVNKLSMDKYKIIGNVSAGAHGIVLKAIRSPNYGTDLRSTEDRDEKLFAIKRIFIRKKSFSISVIREIKSLQLLNKHMNVSCIAILNSSSVNMVFPLYPVNLTTFIYEYNLTNIQRSIYTYMILDGLAYCHSNSIIHRDLKPSNLLIDWQGILKLADFGQARLLPGQTFNQNQTTTQNKYDPKLRSSIDVSPQSNGLLSHQVCTRWYRPPELLYGSNDYDWSIDLWSVGCVVAEMNQKWPLFKGESDIEQLCVVVKSLGQPSTEWAVKMPDYNKVIIVFDENDTSLSWHEKLYQSCQDPLAVDFVRQLIKYESRPSADQMKEHSYVSTAVMMINERGSFDERFLVNPKSIRQLVGPPNPDDQKI
uniref:Cyclin-dependent kinase 20 n=1 Tax=Tetranychus urticae TaxID=32264 RepID=T1KYV4_TETUR